MIKLWLLRTLKKCTNFTLISVITSSPGTISLASEKTYEEVFSDESADDDEKYLNSTNIRNGVFVLAQFATKDKRQMRAKSKL